MQAVPGPQTTAWLLPSVPNCAGVALSSEWLVYSFHSFQPVVCSLPVRAVLFILLPSPARRGNSSPQRRAFLPSLFIPGTFKFPRQDTENFLELIWLTDLLMIEKWEILANCWQENAIKSLCVNNGAERLNV